jgi:serine/threonine protein kinase/Tol biopolymer transport system component
MSFAAGERLGPYEILGPLGHGSMGEVFRARDERLGRAVALKILPTSLAEDAERLRRFEREARAAGVLNHPNLLAVYDVGTHDGTPYIISELLEGETLRELIDGGPLPLRKAVDYAVQICRGLAAAHEKGIVHRDLKPENVVVTRDGRVKIVDFGIAKPVGNPGLLSESSEAPTTSMNTGPGVVLGTAGYLAPEQVKGLPVDHRSDIFSFGSVLYEMLSGLRAFKRETPVETMTALLREDPPALTAAQGVPASLALIVQHCLEKNPEQRFQSARDVAFDLESLSNPTSREAALPAEAPLRRRRTGVSAASGGLLLIAGVLLGSTFWKRPVSPGASYKQLTFRRGYVASARFSADPHMILYSAAWQGGPPEVFSTRPEGPESRSLGFEHAELLAVSRSGELALSLGRHGGPGLSRVGTLARAPFGGGAPREVMEDVEWADWSPDGSELAIVRLRERRDRLEYPAGRLLYETSGWISSPRVSPRGDAVAFLDHPVQGGTLGSVALVDRAGRKRTLSKEPMHVMGLAWHGSEIWFTGARTGGNRALYAVTLSGVERFVLRVAGGLTLEDVAPDGSVLVTHGTERGGIIALPPGETRERDLSWLDWSVVRDLSADGRRFLFHEAGEGAERASIYLGHTSGEPAVRLGHGHSGALSPDGRWAIAVTEGPSQQLVLLPTGAGESRRVELGDVSCDEAWWFPDGQRLLVIGSPAGQRSRAYVRELSEPGTLRPLTEEGYFAFGNPISADGRTLALHGPQSLVLVDVDSKGPPRPVPGSTRGDQALAWTADGRGLFVLQREGLVSRIDRVELASGKRQPWRVLSPADPAGIIGVGSQLVTPDGQSYIYSYVRWLSDLYLVDGLQ